MYSFVFKEKLRRLNPSLYLKEDIASQRDEHNSASGIYSRAKMRDDKKSNYNQLDTAARQWLTAKESGNMDTYITACPNGWIPEYDVIDVDTGRLVAKGWRTIVLFLVKQRQCSLERARNIFSRTLGEHTWDLASYEGRLQMARKAAKWKSTQEQIAAITF